MEFVYACVASFKMGLGGLNYFCFFVQATLSRDRLVGFVTYPPCMVVLPTQAVLQTSCSLMSEVILLIC